MDYKTAIVRYCNYQERCHAEVRGKLLELGCRGDEIENLLCDLIELGILSEERYAKAFVRGKFHVKQWGRIKIVQRLRMHKVSDYCIKQALKEIDPEIYFNTLNKLAEIKWRELRQERNPFVKKTKTFRYLQQKGYEPGLISEILKDISST